MTTSVKPLLSIGIPTYNRCQLLEHLLTSIIRQAERYQLQDQVEIIVSDNASTDGTSALVQEMMRRHGRVILYHRNPKNLGAIKNFLMTLELAQGRFWMVYGDDDLMVDGALPEIIGCINNHSDKILFVFNQQPAHRVYRIKNFTTVSLEKIVRTHLYYLGNAGVFAVNTTIARERYLKNKDQYFTSCWPQTELALLSLLQQTHHEPAILAPIFSVNSVQHDENTAYTSWYIFETLLYSLYRILSEMKTQFGEGIYRSGLRHLFSFKRYIFIVRNIFYHITYFDDHETINQTRRSAGEAFASSGGQIKMYFFLIKVLLFIPPVFRKPVFWLVFFISNPIGIPRLRRRIRLQRSSTLMKQSQQHVRKYERSDYYD